jgi:putative endopeptidase
VIGHELTHGFDDQGRKFDAEGKLARLVDAGRREDLRGARHDAREQYSAFEPLPGVHVNGDLTMGENIADLGGLTMALEAYHASLEGKPAPVSTASPAISACSSAGRRRGAASCATTRSAAWW